MFVMLVITLVAVGAAVAAWLRPIPQTPAAAPPKPTYTAQQVADAKSKVCGAYEKVRRAAYMNSSRTGGDDPTAQLAVAVNERQVFVAGSAYLLTTLSEQPATPAELAAAIRNLTDLYQVITLNGLASDPSEPEKRAAYGVVSVIERLCK
jgi:hypothetical protein